MFTFCFSYTPIHPLLNYPGRPYLHEVYFVEYPTSSEIQVMTRVATSPNLNYMLPTAYFYLTRTQHKLPPSKEGLMV